MTDIITNSDQNCNNDSNINQNSVDEPKEINKSISLENATKELLSLHGKFKTLSKEEILEYVKKEDTSKTWIQNLIPVGRDKCVTTGGASSTGSRMTLKGIECLVNNIGTIQRIDGINHDEEATSTVKPYGFASQCRHDFVTADLDCSVFAVENIDGRNKLVSKLPEKLIIWVAIHHPYALRVRGNRARLTLLFRISPELREYLKGKGNKFNFSLTTGTGEKVEINFGNVNNTVWGAHPTAKYYQQILPDSDINNGLMGELSLEDFIELEKILTDESYEKSEAYTGKASQGRVLLEDAYEIWAGALDDMDTYRNLSRNFDEANKPEFKLSVRDLLNPEVKECLEGLKYFNGSNYKEADDDEVYSVPPGNRYMTWFNVGSDVNSLIWLFDRLDIEYDEDEIDSIIDELWERTDTSSDKPGGDEYTTDNAIANFNATSMAPTVKIDYLRNALMPRLRLAISNIWEVSKSKELERRKKILAERKLQQDTSSDPISDGGNSDEPGEKGMNQETKNDTKNESGEKKKDEFEFDFESDVKTEPISQDDATRILFGEDYVDVERKEGERKGHQEKVDKLDGKLPSIDVGELVGNINEKTESSRNAYLDAKSDDWSLFPESLRSHVENTIGTKTDGMSYAMMTQTLALLSASGKHVQIHNLEFDKHKTEKQCDKYWTNFVPFTAVVADSGTGKSGIKEKIHYAAIEMLESLEKIDAIEQQLFKNQFGDKKGTKFKENEIDPATKKFKDELLATVTGIVTCDHKLQLNEFLSCQNSVTFDSITDAGLRDILRAQEALRDVKDATQNNFFQDAFLHPICLYSDELGDMFKRLYDSTITFGGSSEFFMQRKSANRLKMGRAGMMYNFETAAMPIAGNLIPTALRRYLEKEMRDGTIGISPRFNFAYIESKDEDRDRTGEIFNDNKTIEAAVDMMGIMMSARYVSSRATSFGEDCPYYNRNRPLIYTEDSQTHYGKYLEKIKARTDRLIAKYPEFSDYIKSVKGKASSELAIFAGGICLLEQINELWQQVKTMLPSYEKMFMALTSDNKTDKAKLVQLLEVAHATKSTKHIWTREINVNQIKKAEQIVLHHYSYLEMVMEQIAEAHSNNLATRAKEATQEKVIESVKGDSFVLEKQTEKVIKGICQTVLNATPALNFTISELSKRCSIVRTLIKDENIRRAEQIVDMLCELDILERTHISSVGTQKYHLKITVIELNKRTPSILAAISENF